MKTIDRSEALASAWKRVVEEAEKHTARGWELVGRGVYTLEPSKDLQAAHAFIDWIKDETTGNFFTFEN